jgi:Holliday junction resolvase RusA-like endonuclease
MIPPLEFTVPGPPVPKARARTVRRQNGAVHSFTPEPTSEYAEHVRCVAWAAVVSYQRNNGARWNADAKRYRLTCCFFRQSNRGDLDNYIKAVKDALNRKRGQTLVWPDDARVTDYGPMSMQVDRVSPRAWVRIEVIE